MALRVFQSARAALESTRGTGLTPTRLVYFEEGGFKQDVKRAWSDTRAGVHRAGRDIRDGARSAGHATGEAFRSGWRKVKESFAGAPEPARPGGAG
jgi:hypothetical protein